MSEKEVKLKENVQENSRNSIALLFVIFITSLLALIYIYMNFPDLDE